MEKFKRMLPTLLMIIFELAVGILLLIDAEGFTTAVFTGFGIVLMVIGLVMLISYLRDRKNGEESSLTLVSAILELAVGAIFAFGSSLIISIIALTTLIYGIIMIVKGVFKLSDFVTLKRSGYGASAVLLLSALLSVILGAVIVINPFETTVVLWMFMGIVLIVEACVDMIALIMGLRLTKMIEAEAEDLGDDY